VTVLSAVSLPTVASSKAPSSSTDTEDACTTTPPPGYVVELGYGHGNEATALGAARDEAMERLIRKVCADHLSTARCDGIQRSIRSWEEGYYDRRTRSACAAVAVRQDRLDEMDREATSLDREIARFAAEVGQQGVGLLRHEAPVWESGCAAGEVGDYLKATFEGPLGDAGVQLDQGERIHATAARFHMKLAPGPEGIRVTGYLQHPGEAGWTPVAGPKFALDLFGVEAAEQGECAPDERLGLQDGQRHGADGLAVWVDLPEGRNLYCEGEEIAPRIRVSAPARVQLYSVQRSGVAHLVWPMDGDGFVEDELRLDGGVLLADESLGDERLVAVAIPAGRSFGPTDPWRGYCKAADDFGEAFYPAGAAVGTATYTVRPQGGAVRRWTSRHTATPPSPRSPAGDRELLLVLRRRIPFRDRLDWRPPAPHVQLHRVEGLGADRPGPFVLRRDDPVPVLQPKHLERLLPWIDEPGVAHALPSVDRELAYPVDAYGGRREDLADPVRCLLEKRHVGEHRHPLASPASQVRDQDVRAEVQLRLDQDPPPSRASRRTGLPVEGTEQGVPHRGRGPGVGRRGPGPGEQFTVDDLGDLPVRHL